MKETETVALDGHPEKMTTILKFTESKKTGAYVAFVQKGVGGWWRGVREDARGKKKVCVVPPELQPQIILGQPYKVECATSKNDQYFTVLNISPQVYTAIMETAYVPNCLYRIEINFGYKTLVFDPQSSIRNRSQLGRFMDVLKSRADIRDHDQVVAEFEMRAKDLLRRYQNDGFIYKAD